MFAKLTDSLKREFSSIASSGARHMVFGSLFLLVSVIFLCAASVPLWTGRIRMFPGGAFSVFTVRKEKLVPQSNKNYSAARITKASVFTSPRT